MGDARETEKDPDAFRTISEVAEDLNLPQHVLRFWETRFPQIKPVKRAGGRRFYRPEDIDLLRGIQQLLYREGYTIKGVQKILKEQGIRHVQDLGVERDVAVMRSAQPERPAQPQDGVMFGGLLGLLPRRRGKEAADPALAPLPRDVELPLPFPDPEADRDLEEDQGEPVAPLPVRAQARERRVADRRFDDGAYDERVYEERIYEERSYIAEPRRSPVPDQHREPHFDDEPRLHRPEFYDEGTQDAPAPENLSRRPEPRLEGRAARGDVRQARQGGEEAPSFAPSRAARPGPVPQRRPTRGPAANVSTAPTAEDGDPMLPFMEQAPAPVTDPLEERIRRLKERDAGPPEEYLPPKLRRPPNAADAERSRGASPPPVDQRPPGGRAAPPTSAWPELARATVEVEQDLAAWHEHLRPEHLRPEPPQPEDLPAQRDFWAEEEVQGDDPRYATYDDGEDDASDEAWDGLYDTPEQPQVAAEPNYGVEPGYAAQVDWTDADGFDPAGGREVPEPHVPAFHVSAPVSARLGMGGLGAAGSVRLQPPAHQAPMPHEAPMPNPPMSAHRAPVHAEPAPSPRESAPLRLGPLRGPIIEEEIPAPAPLSVGVGMASGAAGMGPWSRNPQGGVIREAPPAPVQPQPVAAQQPAWHGHRGAYEDPAAYAQAPIDPYLPPHLRNEPQRPMGQGGVQPVLSREDVHRLQATLYELGECRRLLREVTEPAQETTSV